MPTSKHPILLAAARWRGRALIALAVLVVGVGACGAWDRVTTPPSESEAREIVFGNDLLGYALWGGRPYVAFRLDGRVIYDRLWMDPISIEFPPVPRWQLTGRWSSMPLTGHAASVGVASCVRCAGDAVLFGEVRSTDIVAMEVRRGDTWERFDMSAPGFLVRTGGSSDAIEGYRWLDGSGAAVYATDRATPLLD